MTDVFISYSRKDKEFVRKLHTSLEEHERDAWVDWENIPLTADWLEEIKAGIESSDSFIYVISPDSVQSDVCGIELAHALQNKKRLIPIMHRDLVAEYDQAALHPTISSHNWLFFRQEDDFDEAFEKLISALDADLEHMHTHTRLLVKAKEWVDRDRDASLLLRDSELRSAESWLSVAMSKQPEPTEMHTEYIMSSHNIANQRQRSAYVRVLIALGVAVGLSILSLVLYQEASNERVAAEIAAAAADAARVEAAIERDRAEEEAIISQSLAIASIAQQTNDRIQAVALALAAARITDPPTQVSRALADVVYAPGVRHIFIQPGDNDDVSDVGLTLSRVVYSEDASRVAAASEDNSIVIWNTLNSRLVLQLNADSSVHTVPVTDLVYRPNSEELVTIDSDGKLARWNATTGELIDTWQHDVGLTRLAIMPEGDRVFIGRTDGLIVSYRLDDGATQVFGIEANGSPVHASEITAIELVPKRQRLLTGDDDGRVAVWDLTENTRVLASNFHRDTITSISAHPDNVDMVTTSADESVKRITIDRGSIEVEYFGHTNQIMDSAISPDGNFLVTASQDRTIILWEINSGNPIDRLWAHGNWVVSVDFHPTERRVVSSSSDGTAMEWDLKPGNLERVYLGHEDWVRAVDISHDDQRIVSAGDDNTVRVWQLETGEELLTLRVSDVVRDVRFSSDSRFILAASRDGGAYIWDAADGDLLRILQPHGFNADVVSIDVTADDSRVITGTEDGRAAVWNFETGAVLMRLHDHAENNNGGGSVAILDVAFSPDGTRALTASQDATVIYWDLETGEPLHVLTGHSREALSVAFGPDGTRAISGSRGAEFFYWDLEAGEEIFHSEQHGSSVRGVAFSTDGTTALSASADLSILQWDLEKRGVTRAFNAHIRTVYDVDYTSNGTYAVSASRDGTLVLWRIDDLRRLQLWMKTNRYVQALSNEDCATYGVDCGLERSTGQAQANSE